MANLRTAFLLLLLTCLIVGASPSAGASPPKEGKLIERYPPSFRLAVQKAIDKAADRLKATQAPDGTWGNAADPQAMGHTALPLLALLKAGVPRDDVQVVRAFAALRTKRIKMVYSVAVYMMAIHAAYEPALDTLDSDVDRKRRDRSSPKKVRAQLSAEDRLALKKGRDYLLEAHRPGGLWHYDVLDADTARKPISPTPSTRCSDSERPWTAASTCRIERGSAPSRLCWHTRTLGAPRCGSSSIAFGTATPSSRM